MAPMATLSSISRMIRPAAGPSSPSPSPNIQLSPVDGEFEIPQQRPRARGGMPPPPEDLRTAEGSQHVVNEAVGNKDSLTLGQLKAHMVNQPKAKQTQFDFRYDDTDTLMSELQEFFPYSEMSQIGELPRAFEESFHQDWTKSSMRHRREYLGLQLEYLESPVPQTRLASARRITYIIQGVFAETTSPEHQLHWVMENAKIVRSMDGVACILQALKNASAWHDLYTLPLDSNRKPPAPPPNGMNVHDYVEELNQEISQYIGMLYFVVEVFRSDESFGDELMELSPPLPVYLFSVLAGLRDKSGMGYPVKKLVLLVWKTLLACLGGTREAYKVKGLSRELAGLPPVAESNFTKASPIDIASFRKDISLKYPTFTPSPGSADVSKEKLAEAIKPIPVRPSYHSQPENIENSISVSQAPMHGTGHYGNMQPGTPAPTPPQSPAPKPKKQQYQTDPTRPFVFPYSRSPGGTDPSRLVPFAIDEADKLYNRHVYVSLGLHQMWETREDLLREERGLGVSGLIGFGKMTRISDEYDDEEDEALVECMRRDWKYEEEELECARNNDMKGQRAAKDKRMANKRLYRIEVLYRSILPMLQSCVVVLLKLLLATVTAVGPTPMEAVSITGLSANIASPTMEERPILDDRPPPSREEIDILRHREITSKGVSAILLLLLKWFKASHVLKFHYFGQLLLDSNCLLLALKMFGLAEVSTTVQAKNECEDDNFFRYCYLNCSKNPQPKRPEDTLLQATKPVIRQAGPGEEEVEMISDYSWRNFFTSINFVKILQKFTKHRTHRILLLVQYKSSQILKRMLRVNHPMLQLQVLKVIKSQIPFCGRKWRQSNMKTITSIYLNCRPELRDEWLAGSDVDNDVNDALPQEQALRSLIAFYNSKTYTYTPIAAQEGGHRRSVSNAGGPLEDPVPYSSHSRLSSADSDIFPPNRTAPAGSHLPYSPDSIIDYWMHEYEDVLGEVFGDSSPSEEEGWERFGEDGHIRAPGPAQRDGPTWNKLNEILRANGAPEDDVISDSESIVSIGELGPDARFMEETPEEERAREAMSLRERRRSGNENTWEHLSQDTLSLLPKSPTTRRRSSSGSGGSPLRPVILGGPTGPVFDEDEEEDMPGPMPIETDTRDAKDRNFGPVDEVEFAYGE